MLYFTSVSIRLFLLILILSLFGCAAHKELQVPISEKQTGISIFEYDKVFIECPKPDLCKRTAQMLEGLGFTIVSEIRDSYILKAKVNHIQYPLGLGTAARIEILFQDAESSIPILGVQSDYQSWTTTGADISGAFGNILNDLKKRKQDYTPRTYDKQSTPDLDLLKKYVSRKKAEPIEGIWLTSDNLYEIGIYYDTTGTCEFRGVILSSRRPNWTPGEQKLCLKRGATGRVYVGTYWLGNKEPLGTTFLLEGELLKTRLRVGEDYEDFTIIKTFPSKSNSSFVESDLPRTGSGILLDSTGLIVTCAHVVSKANKIKVVHWSSSDSIDARVLLQDEINDVALLKTRSISGGGKISHINLGFDKKISLGDPVYCIGFPLSDILGSSPRFNTGSITALVGMKDDPRYIQVSVPVQPGNSGAPLFSDDGTLIGIITSKLSEEYVYQSTGTLPQNVNFAIKSQYILSLLSNLKDWQKSTGGKISKSEALEHVVIILCE